MTDDLDTASVHERWARLRYAIVGTLFAAPPARGELQAALRDLSQRTWKHPVTGKSVRFGVSTLERWYYMARNERRDPVGVLQRKVRKDLGLHLSLSATVQELLQAQYVQHMGWSVQLHYRNLEALAETRPEIEPIPSYSSVLRFFRSHGLNKRRRVATRDTEGVARAEDRLGQRERRSWEAAYVNAVWHWDGHHGSRQVLTPEAQYETPILIGVLDDRSRLVCHMQWFLGAERAEIIAHTLSQAIMRRGMPASTYHDNGPAMVAEEIEQGLGRLGAVDARTLPESPDMNGKMEVFWATVEGQLMPMLENVKPLTLEALNEATLAWCEYDYNRSKHSETGERPIDRFMSGPFGKERVTPDGAQLRLAFTRTVCRTQRQTDGTVVLDARRFEIPNAYRHLKRVLVRYAHWDLTHVYLVDEHTGQVLCRLYPLNKVANASGVRRPLGPIATPQMRLQLNPKEAIPPLKENPAVPPLLSKLLRMQADTGLPPPYQPLGCEGNEPSGDGCDDKDTTDDTTEK